MAWGWVSWIYEFIQFLNARISSGKRYDITSYINILWFKEKATFDSVQFSSVAQSCPTLSNPMACSTPGLPVHQNSLNLLRLMYIELVMPLKHFILCHPLLLPLSIFPSIRVFSYESILCIRWPKYGVTASASVLPINIQD